MEQKLDSNFLNKRQRYYSNINIQFQLLDSMRNREVIFMDRNNPANCIRGLWLKSIPYLKQAFNYFRFFKKDYNIYISVAKYSHIPMFTYNLSERREEMTSWRNGEYKQYLIDYSFLFDFDEHKFISDGTERGRKTVFNRSKMIEELFFIMDRLKKTGIKHYIVPSGKNFHIVGQNILADRTKPEEIKKLIIAMKENYNLEYLDLSGCGHHFKIMKCPYSLVGETCVFPLDKFHIENISDYNYFDANNILEREYVAFRGLIWH